MDEIHSTIRKLCKIDTLISNELQNLGVYRTKMISAGIDVWFEQTFASGSLVEGAWWAKCFRPDVVRILEADFMTPIGKIEDAQIGLRGKLKPIKNSPGFFMLTSKDLLEVMYDGVRNKYHNWTKTNSKNKTKDVCHSSVPEFITSQWITSKQFEKSCEFVADILLKPDEPSQVEVMFTTDGPSALTVIKVKSAEEVLAETQVDTVPCIQLSSWPDQMQFQQWVNRKRKWPNPRLVSQTQHLLYIVAKVPPKVETEIETNNVWRLSFSKVEMLYTSTYTENQRNIYYLFKIMFYANIKKFESGGKTMPSYFCKTTMLWLMEEGDGFGEVDFEESIKMLFQKLNEFLGNGFLPNFFQPSINLLDGYPEELIAICSYMIKELIENPLHYVPRNLDDECEFLESAKERFKRSVQFWNILETFYTQCFSLEI